MVSPTEGKKEASGWTDRNILTPMSWKRLASGHVLQSFLSYVYMSTDYVLCSQSSSSRGDDLFYHTCQLLRWREYQIYWKTEPRYKFGKYSINQITWTQMVTCPLWATTQDSVPAWHAVLTFGVVFYHRYVSQHFGYKTKNLWSLTNNAICIRFLTSFVRLILTLGAVSLVFCEKTFVIGHLVIKRGY